MKMESEVSKLIEIARKKGKLECHQKWSNGSQTFFEEIQKELHEVQEELNLERQVFLEDELGDVLWDYINILVELEKENKINLENVFQRATKKYNERISGIIEGKTWEEIKKQQKLRLSREQLSND